MVGDADCKAFLVCLVHQISETINNRLEQLQQASLNGAQDINKIFSLALEVTILQAQQDVVSKALAQLSKDPV